MSYSRQWFTIRPLVEAIPALHSAKGLGGPMLMDYEIRGCARTCVVSGQALQPGEVYFSVLELKQSDIVRSDYSVMAWKGPPEHCVGWWRSRIPTREDCPPKLAPVEVMLNLFESLADQHGDLEFRYLLALLLLRRRVVRRDGSSRDHEGREILELYCPRRAAQYEIIVAEPDAEMAIKLQGKMLDLLYGEEDSRELPESADENTL